MSDLEKREIEMNINYMFNEIKKMNVGTNKITKENFYYPLVVGGGLVLAAVVIVKLFLN